MVNIRGTKSLESPRDSNRLASSQRDAGLPWKGTQCNSTTLHAHSAGTPTVSESHRTDRRKMHGSYRDTYVSERDQIVSCPH